MSARLSPLTQGLDMTQRRTRMKLLAFMRGLCRPNRRCATKCPRANRHRRELRFVRTVQ